MGLDKKRISAQMDFGSAVNVRREMMSKDIQEARKKISQDLMLVGIKPTNESQIATLLEIGAYEVLKNPKQIERIKKMYGV